MKKILNDKFIFFFINWFAMFILILFLMVIIQKYQLYTQLEIDSFSYGAIFMLIVIAIYMLCKNIYIKTGKQKQNNNKNISS